MSPRDVPTDPAPPLACTLTPGDAHERQRWFQTVMSHAIEVADQPEGQIAYFAEDDALEGELRALASAEADCCKFLRFEIQRGHGRISLGVTGPTDARPIIEQLLAGADER